MPIYFIQNEVTKNVLIGHADDVDARLQELQRGNDCKLKVLATIDGDQKAADRYKEECDTYRILTPGGEDDDPWFAITVVKTGNSVLIKDREAGRTPKKQRKRMEHQICLRLSAQQLALLQAYARIRDKTEVDAIRFMINGLADWLARQNAKRGSAENYRQSAVTHQQEPRFESGIDSGLSQSRAQSINDGQSISDGVIDVGDDNDQSDETPTVGDFGGRPSIGLPRGNPWSDEA